MREAKRAVVMMNRDVTPQQPSSLNPIDLSQSSDESSVGGTPSLEQLVRLACEQATKLPTEIRWLISLLLEIRTAAKRCPDSDWLKKSQNDLAAMEERVR